MIEECDKFGVILILQECSFSAELHRDSIPEMMQSIDDRLTEQGAPEETLARCAMMMNNALRLSHLVANHEMDHAAGVTDIAYSFVYAFGKQVGFEQMGTIRGLTGSCLRDNLTLNPCLDETDFQQQSYYLNRKMEDHEERGDDIWDYDISFPPTVH